MGDRKQCDASLANARDNFERRGLYDSYAYTAINGALLSKFLGSYRNAAMAFTILHTKAQNSGGSV
jgi:hypothetical protein